MIELLVNTLQLLLKGKLFRDPRYVFTRLALCNLAIAITVIAAFVLQAATWLLLSLLAAIGAAVPYVLRNVKYR